MPLFKKVAIVGTGLIGGSLGLAIREKHLASEVVGISRTQKNIDCAVASGAVHSGSRELDIIKGADLVILALPVQSISVCAKKVSEFIGPECIVTDVGSTKQHIVSHASRLFKNFIGGHPLAGSEKRSVQFASPELFKKSFCILTPTKTTPTRSLKKLTSLWNAVGARVVYLPPSEHDKILAMVSHMPHMISFSLINSIPERYLKFATPSLKEMTRIAGSDPGLWNDIFETNTKSILAALSAFEKNLRDLRNAVSSRQKITVKRLLKKAQEKRGRIQ